ncbi:MAG: hypothetical protein ACYC6V_09020, partial [Bacillota bacterium]
GFFGFLVLGLVLYVLDRYRPTDAAGRRDVDWSLWLLNIGMGLMGLSLLTAGALEVYRLRFLGREFMWVQSTLRPFLALRSLGGLIFGLGGVLFAWGTARPWIWANTPGFARPVLKPLFRKAPLQKAPKAQAQ